MQCGHRDVGLRGNLLRDDDERGAGEPPLGASAESSRMFDTAPRAQVLALTSRSYGQNESSGDWPGYKCRGGSLEAETARRTVPAWLNETAADERAHIRAYNAAKLREQRTVDLTGSDDEAPVGPVDVAMVLPSCPRDLLYEITLDARASADGTTSVFAGATARAGPKRAFVPKKLPLCHRAKVGAEKVGEVSAGLPPATRPTPVGTGEHARYLARARDACTAWLALAAEARLYAGRDSRTEREHEGRVAFGRALNTMAAALRAFLLTVSQPIAPRTALAYVLNRRDGFDVTDAVSEAGKQCRIAGDQGVEVVGGLNHPFARRCTEYLALVHRLLSEYGVVRRAVGERLVQRGSAVLSPFKAKRVDAARAARKGRAPRAGKPGRGPYHLDYGESEWRGGKRRDDHGDDDEGGASGGVEV